MYPARTPMVTKKKPAPVVPSPTLVELSARVDSLAARLRAIEGLVRPDDTFAKHLARKLRGAADKKDPYRRSRNKKSARANIMKKR